jgi:hypothetical protein
VIEVDWQQVVTTCIAGGALIVLLRPLLPAWLARRRPRAGQGCPSCAAGQAACAKESRPMRIVRSDAVRR